MATSSFWHYYKLSPTNSVQDKHKHRKCDHFLSYSKRSKCLPPAFAFSFNLFLKPGIALFCGKSSHVFSSATLNLETIFLASDEAFKKNFTHRSPDMISARSSNLESLVAIVSSESFADSWRAGIVERHVLCAQRAMHLAESAAPSGSSRLQSSMNFLSRN